ncbi:hypothetical protein [Oscillatoria sp. FACHB-1406]|uniref:hypothetical protein n=1 Tax=Oscillatoria sp. FACHB-1406 TaxID=2692846 RepID=UPI0016879596|nr:hypothetical protein [Oscillatoria sp. FACHB-1406]MBD2577432.1 hypothetical protein [Oscillatoria sp. FACHB-1406]
MVSLTFQDGWFHHILGKAVRGHEFIFIPVLGDLGDREIVPYYRDTEEDVCLPISALIEGKLPRLLGEFPYWNEKPVYLIDAIWVRARIPAIFGKNLVFSRFAPDYKYRIIEQMFVACERRMQEEWIAYPFICEDCELSTQLRFNSNEAVKDAYERIARDFCQLLLKDAERIYSFCDGYLYDDELFGEKWERVTLKGKNFEIESVEAEFW